MYFTIQHAKRFLKFDLVLKLTRRLSLISMLLKVLSMFKHIDTHTHTHTLTHTPEFDSTILDIYEQIDASVHEE